jgi:putative ABC transport system permease protein
VESVRRVQAPPFSTPETMKSAKIGSMQRARTRLILTMLVAAVASVLAAAAGQPASDTPGILVTRQLMATRNLHVGDVVQLASDASGTDARPFRIDGVYEPTPDPMRFAQPKFEVRLHLPDLASFVADPSDPGTLDTVTSINVALTNPDDAGRFARDVAARVPGAVARPTSAPDERTATFVVLERFHLAIAIVTVVGSAVFLLALMVMLVEERRGTVGILRLIGFTRRRILVQIFAEGALIALAGAVGGVLFALTSESFFNRFFQWRYDTALIFLRITPWIALQSVAIAVPLGILASLIASWTLLRRELLTLIRR